MSICRYITVVLQDPLAACRGSKKVKYHRLMGQKPMGFHEFSCNFFQTTFAYRTGSRYFFGSSLIQEVPTMTSGGVSKSELQAQHFSRQVLQGTCD